MSGDASPLRPGDRVILGGGRHVGTVKRIVDAGTVEIAESTILGRRAVWSIRLDALTVIGRPYDPEVDAIGSYHDAHPRDRRAGARRGAGAAIHAQRQALRDAQ